MTYREIGKLLCVDIGRVTEILRRGEEIAVQRKLDEIGVKPIDLPKKSTVEKHTTVTKQRKNTKR